MRSKNTGVKRIFATVLISLAVLEPSYSTNENEILDLCLQCSDQLELSVQELEKSEAAKEESYWRGFVVGIFSGIALSLIKH